MTDFEMVEAERFSQALDAIEALAEPDLDPREDPTLFSSPHSPPSCMTPSKPPPARPASSPTACARAPTC